MKYLAAVVTPPANPLIPEWPELIIGAIAFVIVFAVLRQVLLPRIQKTLAERADAIEGGLQLAEARQEASRLRERAREEGAQIIAEMRDQAQAEARRLVDAAHAQIEADRQLAIQMLRTEVGTLAVDLASRVVGESLENEARQRRVVERFIEDLESQPAAPGAGPSGTGTGS